MTKSSQENITLIHHLTILKREIAIEGDLQLATIARVIYPDIDLIIEKLRRLDQLEKELCENGKTTTRTAVS